MIVLYCILGVIVWLILGYIASNLLKSRIESRLHEPVGPEFIPWHYGYMASGLLGLLTYLAIVLTNADVDLYE